MTTNSRAQRRLISQLRPTFIAWPNGFDQFGGKQLSSLPLDFHPGDRHFLPKNYELSPLKFRELLGILQPLKGVNTVWLPCVRARVTPTQSVSDRLQGFAWKHWLPKGCPISVSAEAQKSRLRQASVVREAAQKALREMAFEAELATEPNSQSLPQDSISLKLSLFRDTLTAYLPATLTPHHHRHYKADLRHPASLREDIAECVIAEFLQWLHSRRASAQTPSQLFLPFFGSGTLLYESLSVLWEMHHCLIGKYGALRSSPAAPQATLDHLHKKACEQLAQTSQEKPLQAWGLDHHQESQQSFQRSWPRFMAHLPAAPLENLQVTHTHEDFYALKPEALRQRLPPPPNADAPLLCFLNPPFGKRLRTGEAAAFEKLGRQLFTLLAERAAAGFVLCPDKTTSEDLLKGMKSVTGSSRRVHMKMFPLSLGSLKAQAAFFQKE